MAHSKHCRISTDITFFNDDYTVINPKMSFPILYKTASEVPDKLTLLSTNNVSIYSIDPPLQLLSASHYIKSHGFQNTGLFPMKMKDDVNLAEMLEKIRSQVHQCLCMMVITDIEMNEKKRNTLSKALIRKQHLVQNPINTEGVLWLKVVGRRTKVHISPNPNYVIDTDEYQFIIIVDRICINDDRADMKSHID